MTHPQDNGSGISSGQWSDFPGLSATNAVKDIDFEAIARRVLLRNQHTRLFIRPYMFSPPENEVMMQESTKKLTIMFSLIAGLRSEAHGCPIAETVIILAATVAGIAAGGMISR